MGHALNGSIQDVLIRYHRMAGRRTKWILGTDHAGIATQAQVEKALRAEGTSRQELGREEFVRRVWEWREHYGHTIVEQFKRLGASCDYSEERFTLDEGYHRAVVEVFVALYEQGFIYRDRYIVNWDPGTHSAISDLEVEERARARHAVLDPLRRGGRGHGDDRDGAPRDDAGRHRGGGPPRGRALPRTWWGAPRSCRSSGVTCRSIADEYVKMDFGTGQLKVTPAHDPNDFEIGRRHELDQVSVIGEDGRMTAEAGERFAGLTVMEARDGGGRGAAGGRPDRGRGALRARGALLAPLRRAHRAADLAAVVHAHGRARRARRSRRCASGAGADRPGQPPPGVPRLDGEHPPVVHLAPAVVGAPAAGVLLRHVRAHRTSRRSAPERCEACGGELRQEEDVLDTWFSSALWPFATLGWPDADARSCAPSTPRRCSPPRATSCSCGWRA